VDNCGPPRELQDRPTSHKRTQPPQLSTAPQRVVPEFSYKKKNTNFEKVFFRINRVEKLQGVVKKKGLAVRIAAICWVLPSELTERISAYCAAQKKAVTEQSRVPDHLQLGTWPMMTEDDKPWRPQRQRRDPLQAAHLSHRRR